VSPSGQSAGFICQHLKKEKKKKKMQKKKKDIAAKEESEAPGILTRRLCFLSSSKSLY
jgi:hypothetical protein